MSINLSEMGLRRVRTDYKVISVVMWGRGLGDVLPAE